MNKKQLSEHIGNIDDRLVQQAERLPNYAMQHRQKRIRQLLAAAASLVLMVFGFSVGAIAFAQEIIVEVPVEQEILELEGVNLTLILPDSWKGQYSIEKKGNNFIVYNPQIREAVSDGTDIFDGGVLFTIVCYEESMTEEQFIENGLDFTAYRYLFATSDKTYILHYASDVQYDPSDKEQESAYQKMMSEIEDIQIVVNNLFPPKDIVVVPEGMAEEIEHIAQVKEPESEFSGYAIYIDTERYYSVEENDAYYIRPIGAEEGSELICEMEIEEMADISWEEAARTIRNQMCEEQEEGKWDSVSDVLHDTDIERLYFCVSEGNAWDSAQEEHYFYSMDGQGTYHIVLRYFLEATEGNGVRFHTMLDTFTLVAAQDVITEAQEPEEPSQNNVTSPEPGLSADGQEIEHIVEEFAAAYFGGDMDTIQNYLTIPYEWDIDVYTGTGVISEVNIKGLTDIEEEEIGSIRIISLEYRNSSIEDILLYLTLEFIKQEDGWKIQFYGMEG